MTRLPVKRRSLNSRIEELIAIFTPRIRAAFLEAMGDAPGNINFADFARAIEQGDALLAFRILGLDGAAMRPITRIIEEAFETGGVTTVATFPKVRNPTTNTKMVFRFDVRNSRAEAWLRDHSSQLVTRITSEQLNGIQQFLNLGVQAGRNPRNVALDIVGRINPVTQRREGGIIGLTPGQQRWVANARKELGDPASMPHYFTRERRDKRFDSIVQAAINEGKALDAETINRLTGRYSDSLLQLRGETIARTEAINAMNKSKHEAFQQVVDSGAVSPNAVMRVWDSAGADGRTRDSHLQMEGQRVPLGEPFKAPDGSLLMFPGDTSLGASPEETINCRCVERIAVDWLDGIQ